MPDTPKRGFFMRNRKWLITAVIVVCVVGTLVVAQASKGSKPKEEEPPFRLGKTQAETLQVSVREVGVGDPEVKVDGKATVSGGGLGLEGK